MALFRCNFNYEVKNSPTQQGVILINGEGLLSSSRRKRCSWEMEILCVNGGESQNDRGTWRRDNSGFPKIQWVPSKHLTGVWFCAAWIAVILTMAFPVINVRHRYACAIRGKINRTDCKSIFKILIPNGSTAFRFLGSKGRFALQARECLEDVIITPVQYSLHNPQIEHSPLLNISDVL